MSERSQQPSAIRIRLARYALGALIWFALYLAALSLRLPAAIWVGLAVALLGVTLVARYEWRLADAAIPGPPAHRGWMDLAELRRAIGPEADVEKTGQIPVVTGLTVEEAGRGLATAVPLMCGVMVGVGPAGEDDPGVYTWPTEDVGCGPADGRLPIQAAAEDAAHAAAAWGQPEVDPATVDLTALFQSARAELERRDVEAHRVIAEQDSTARLDMRALLAGRGID